MWKRCCIGRIRFVLLCVYIPNTFLFDRLFSLSFLLYLRLLFVFLSSAFFSTAIWSMSCSFTSGILDTNSNHVNEGLKITENANVLYLCLQIMLNGTLFLACFFLFLSINSLLLLFLVHPFSTLSLSFYGNVTQF